jgi:protein phosphatase
VREDNQDRYLARRERGVTLMAVADGVAGEAGGDVASATAVEALAGTFEFAAKDAAAALAAAMRAANDAVLRATEERGHRAAASTLVAAAVRGRRCAVANLGDSRAYLVRGGVARQITADHAGLQPNSITRFVGDPRGVMPDVFIEVLGGRDRLVLCSDGLTRHVQADEIARTAAGVRPERAARALVDLANERGGVDNVTVVVFAPPSRIPSARVGVVLLLTLVVLGVIAALSALFFALPAV